MKRQVVRCYSCSQVHIAVAPTEVPAQPLEVLRRCSRCGCEGTLAASHLLVDELLLTIPTCVLDPAACAARH